MPIVLYHNPMSPPCMSVRLVAAAIGLELDLKFVNPMTGDHLKPEFLKINPKHTVPTIDDDGFYLWESRAISIYLIGKYAKNDTLYPNDPQKRAFINHRLFLDLGTLFAAYKNFFCPQATTGVPSDPVFFEKCHEVTDYLDKFLEGQNYVANNQLSVADLMMAPTVVAFATMDADMSRHKNTMKWLRRIANEAPKYNEIMDEGLVLLKAHYDRVFKK